MNSFVTSSKNVRLPEFRSNDIDIDILNVNAFSQSTTDLYSTILDMITKYFQIKTTGDNFLPVIQFNGKQIGLITWIVSDEPVENEYCPIETVSFSQNYSHITVDVDQVLHLTL